MIMNSRPSVQPTPVKPIETSPTQIQIVK
jgi:hypothetical protein